MMYIIVIEFSSNMGYSEEIVEEAIRMCGIFMQLFLLLQEIKKENKRFQGNSACAPCSVCPDAAQSRSAGVGDSTYELTGDSTPKNTESLTEQNLEETIPQLLFTDSKAYTSNCRVNSPRTGPVGQKYEMWGSNQKDTGNVDLKSNGLSPSLASSSPGEVSFILSVPTGQQRGPGFPENGFQLQAEPSLPNKWKTACEKPSGGCSSPHSKPHYSQNSPSLPLPQLFPSDTSARLAGASDHTDSLVTAVQRFRDMLKIPYKLILKNEPGRADLKHIVIDGSNVAFAHGLHKFFSCRGIAIAVEYFWKLGHRHITVFVPQWRTRRHPNATEQHFLTQLKELGIVALTPSRTVFGERIASHDDRFLLHLADKTGGVIVSNDNFREFVTESVSWREIIAKRLLKYTFVENIFMVPDDPLGRNGPRLEEFLGKEGFVRDMETLLSALPNVDQFDRSHNTQEAIASHQIPYWNQGASSGPWLPQQPHCTSLTTIPGIQQNHLMAAHRPSAETSELREPLLMIFPDSEQNLKIDEILVAQPVLKDLHELSDLVLNRRLGLEPKADGDQSQLPTVDYLSGKKPSRVNGAALDSLRK